MPLDEPGWWYAPHPEPRARLLGPIARVYAWAAARRLARPPAITLPMPVICVGNFTAGGTGKTPLSIHIARHIAARGMAPVILTRGYGGRERGPRWLAAGIDTARDVGDEPMLLSRSAPVMVARDRAAGARAILASTIPADAVVMDDGLQNPAVAKTLRIAVVDRLRGVGNGRVIPAGPLRAPLNLQLALVDAIVLNSPPGAAVAGGQDAGRWLRERFHGPVIAARPEPQGEVDWLAARPVVAFAGIANPQRFFALLEQLGARIVVRTAFPDHHVFTQSEAAALIASASRQGAQLVTTEKDWVRLIGARGALLELKEAARPLAIRLAFDDRDAERLAVLLDAALASRPAANGAGVSDPSVS